MAPKGRSRPILPTIEDSHETEEEFRVRVTAKRRAALQRTLQEILNGNPVPPDLEWAVPDPNEPIGKRLWERKLLRFRALLRVQDRAPPGLGYPDPGLGLLIGASSGPGGPGGPSATSAAAAPPTRSAPPTTATSSAFRGPPGTWIAAAPTTSSASCGPPGTWIAAAPTTSATADETEGLGETWQETWIETVPDETEGLGETWQ